ncbi:MAG: gliding motility-associated C-terminal domain-containing protein [Bacteroidota bacterium]
MMQRILNRAKIVFFFMVLILLQSKAIGQSLNPPTFGFSFVCTKSDTNFFDASVTFDPTSFTAGNKFILELSDKDGFFTTPVQLQQITATTSPGNFVNFAFPTNTNGLSYRFRVRSTSPALTSGSSVPFEAHYKIYPFNFWLNNHADNLSICGTSTVRLSIDDATAQDPSPKAIAGLIYKWFRNGAVIPGETGTFIDVSTSGAYQAFIDYGVCSSFDNGQDEKSQIVNVSIVTSGSVFTISSSQGTNICPSNPTTLSTTSGYTYKWFRDGNEIAGATSNTYVTAVPGKYKVQVGTGACASTSSEIVLTAEDFNLSIDALVAPQTNVIPAGDTITITATTDAANPTYQWFDPNNTSVSTTNTFSTSTPIAGEYKVIVTQTTGCQFPKEIKFKIRNGVLSTKIPNTISPNGDEFNNTWIIPQEYSLPDTEILIVDSYGKEVLKTTNYQNNWPESAIEFKSVNPVFYYIISKNGSPVKKGSITVIK